MIPTRAHGALDYLSAITLVAVPQLLGWRPELARPVALAGVATAGYSLMTRYEWGAVDRITMREHLALDALQGTAFCVAALSLDESRKVRLALAGYGLFALAAAVLTERSPRASAA